MNEPLASRSTGEGWAPPLTTAQLGAGGCEAGEGLICLHRNGKVGGPGGGSIARRRLLVTGWGTSREDRLGHGPPLLDASR